jgi:hypothetical protein|uniref:Uncharacterized protein n=1 Tax=Eutreptiella gymnastica TaxID=73025 RepID=A0A7S4LF01_9EUGL|mmetsp:Transcript_3838/g.6181  ORF Transcript_3838/g.6181 Transcript_3838/m.6181 type:complete len:137 (+) Transcript_3838:1090-1500(+)
MNCTSRVVWQGVNKKDLRAGVNVGQDRGHRAKASNLLKIKRQAPVAACRARHVPQPQKINTNDRTVIRYGSQFVMGQGLRDRRRAVFGVSSTKRSGLSRQKVKWSVDYSGRAEDRGKEVHNATKQTNPAGLQYDRS